MPRCLVRFAQGSGRGGGELRTRLAGPQLNVSRYTEADGGEVDVDRGVAGWLAVAFARRVSARSDPGLVHCSSERGCVAADSMGPREAMLEARRPRMGAGTMA